MLLDMRKGKYWALNSTAVLMLEGLLTDAPLNQLVEELSEKLAADQDSIERDLHGFQRQLVANGILVIKAK
ncbi:PqqD family protein [Streptomyces rubiginosohelvolus]|uniref:PqqD family protein n=1 Tax=Streptomyces rubiginosohelvolus TaxID=67362 RepID=UPI0036C8FB4A